MTGRTQRLIVDCTTRLFGAYGVSLRPVMGTAAPAPRIDPLDPLLTGAVIELLPARVGGRVMGAGRLVFLSTFELIASSRPAQVHSAPLTPASGVDWLYVRDWTRELTNQLAGSVTNQLAGGGAFYAPRQPVALTGAAAAHEMNGAKGEEVRLVSPRNHEVRVQLRLPPGAEVDTTVPPPRLSDVGMAGSVISLDGDDDA